MQRKTLGLALGSGGARGFCHVGVLQALEENNIKIDYITGCSMGAIAGGCYCLNVSTDEMARMSEKINYSVVLDINISLKQHGLVKGQRIVNMVKKLIGEKTFSDCVIPFKATASDLISGELKILDSGLMLTALRASMSVPVAFHAVNIDGDNSWLVDGGVVERIPIPLVKSMGADVVIAVDALGAIRQNYTPKGIISVIERAYLMMDWQSAKEKLALADLVISPDQGDRAIYDFKDNLTSISHGKAATLAKMDEIKRLLEY